MIDADLRIAKVDYVFNDLLDDCYRIASLSRPDNASMIYYTMADDINKAQHDLFACFGKDSLRGFIKGHEFPGKFGLCAEIDWLFVDYKFSHSGIGTRLITEYEIYAKNQGVKQVYVSSVPTLKATNFYTKNGYEPITAFSNRFIKNLDR